MPRTAPRPTDAELAILRVLWNKGACTVREVHEVLAATRPLAYTTTLKLLQIMTEKGLTTREDYGQQHLYRAGHSEKATQRRLVSELLERAFGGSMSQLVMQALASKKTSPEELRAIRRLLDEYKEKDHD
jgi:BlaI family transcriptional regulator, penicillinase repressor